MTVYQLIQYLTDTVSATTSFGEVILWWSEKNNQLYLSRTKPVQDAVVLRR